jgi:ATP-dependent DNA ligase
MMKNSEYEVLRLNETPNKILWCFPPSYKVSKRGKEMVWQISFDGVNNLETCYGQVDGKIQQKFLEVKLNKSNRDIISQALLKASKKYSDKLKEGYKAKDPRYQENDITFRPKLMKGTEYKPGMDLNFPVATQYKLDGIRSSVRLDKLTNKLLMLSYNNNKYTTLEHISLNLEAFLSLLPVGTVLDGELYNHELPFTGKDASIQSIVRTVNSIHPRIKEIYYYIFDIQTIEPYTYDQRYTILNNALEAFKARGNVNSYFTLLPSYIANNHDEIDQQHFKFIELGFEGIIIKRINHSNYPPENLDKTLYVNGRTNNIMKYKFFHDKEVKVIDVKEAQGDQKGVAVFILQDENGNVFNSAAKGELEMKRRWFLDRANLIGKMVTIKYQELSEYGIPRFPVIKAIRDYE